MLSILSLVGFCRSDFHGSDEPAVGASRGSEVIGRRSYT